jgi:hypothetical protein
LAFGQHRIADAPLPRHQRAVARLFLALNSHVTDPLTPVSATSASGSAGSRSTG